MPPLLRLDDVEARYGPVQALHGISLAVDDGQVVAVLGANGAGKTTTLRAISGTVRRSGEIEFRGKPLRGGPESAAKAGIAHVPDSRGLFFGLTVGTIPVFRRRYPLDQRPPDAFRTPAYPILPIAFTIVAAAVVLSVVRADPASATRGAILLAAGVPVFFWFSRKQR